MIKDIAAAFGLSTVLSLVIYGVIGIVGITRIPIGKIEFNLPYWLWLMLSVNVIFIVIIKIVQR